MKILMTGGHAGTTGLSVIKEIRKRKYDADISWIGVQKALTGAVSDTIEYKLYPKYGVKFYPIEAGKVQTKYTQHTISLFFKIPLSFCKAFLTAWRIKPDIILSFGGSISVPVAFYGYLFRVPVIVHEQTAVAGRANLMSANFAKKIAISRHGSHKYFDKSKIVITGNPISPLIKKYMEKNNSRSKVATILFTGGSRGSIWLNNALLPIIKTLLKKYKVIWQVGDNNLDMITNQTRQNLPDDAVKRLNIFGQVDPDVMTELIAKSDIVISRAGANTVSELIALKKPSILVPIPWSYLNEQTENALYMQSLGLARILSQKELNPKNLLREIDVLVRDYARIKYSTKGVVSDDINASKKLVDLIVDELNEKKKV